MLKHVVHMVQDAAHFIVFALGGTCVLQVTPIRGFQFDKY